MMKKTNTRHITDLTAISLKTKMKWNIRKNKCCYIEHKVTIPNGARLCNEFKRDIAVAVITKTKKKEKKQRY